MQKIISILTILLITNCKPMAARESVDDSFISGVPPEKIPSDLYPDYKNLGSLQGNRRIIEASIFFLTKSEENSYANDLAAKRAFVSTISHIGNSMSNTRISAMGGNYVNYSKQYISSLQDNDQFSNVPSFVTVEAGTSGKLGPKDTASVTDTIWKFNIKLADLSINGGTDFGREFGTDLATKDIVVVNGHILIADFNKLKTISNDYLNEQIDYTKKTSDPFVDQVYIEAMKKFVDVSKTAKNQQKPRILVMNSCYSELLENMIFNASSFINSLSENLFMISQKNRSHFGAFYKQVPQFLDQVQNGGNWASLVESMKMNQADAAKAKVDIELEPALRTKNTGKIYAQ
jgi:hypothetical protein